MNRYHTCPVLHPEELRRSRQRLAETRTRHLLVAVTEDRITLALSHSKPDDYFITTSLYWECECRERYFSPQEMACCENCGSFADESPDARIHEPRSHGIHLDYHDPAVRATMDQYNLQSREASQIAKKLSNLLLSEPDSSSLLNRGTSTPFEELTTLVCLPSRPAENGAGSHTTRSTTAHCLRRRNPDTAPQITASRGIGRGGARVAGE